MIPKRGTIGTDIHRQFFCDRYNCYNACASYLIFAQALLFLCLSEELSVIRSCAKAERIGERTWTERNKSLENLSRHLP